MNFNLKKILEEMRILLILIVIAFTVKSTLVEIYVVPTGSMENTILTGDMLIGNKFIYGMRTPTWIGIPYTRMGFSIPWYRLPPFKKIMNGDVTIFEYPRDPFQKYVKRCIGIPGDSIYIDAGSIIINDDTMQFPNHAKFMKGYIYDKEKNEKLYAYLNGNRDNIKGFVVPYKGMMVDFDKVEDWETIITLLVQDGNSVKLNNKHFIMTDPYEVARTHGFIKNKLLSFLSSKKSSAMREQKERMKYINKLTKKYEKKNLINPWHINYSSDKSEFIRQNITVNGTTLADIGVYELKNNYYFFMGDNRDSSYDSRFWGFVPDKQILGTPLFALINLFKFKLRLKVIS